MVREIEGLRVSSAQLAHVLGLTSRRVQQLAKEGVLARGPGGKFDLAASVQAYMASRQDAAVPSVATDRLREARAVEIERRIALRDRELISLAEAMEKFELVTGAFLTALSGLPARITRNVRERHRIESIIDAMRSRLSADFAVQEDALKTGTDG